MKTVKKPIKKDIFTYLLPIVILLLALFCCALYIVVSHNSVISNYIVGYNDIAQLSVAIDGYEQAVLGYIENSDEKNKIEFIDKYNSLNYKIRNLYYNRYDYNSTVKSDIEDISDYMDIVISSTGKILECTDVESVKHIYLDEIEGILYEMRSMTANIMEIQVSSNNKKYESISNASVVLLMVIIAFIAILVALAIKFFIFVDRRISIPSKEIAEWARLMKDDYYQMSPLKYEGQDEIQLISEAFNAVKEKIIDQQKKSDELTQTIQKLKSEEESKKKFVQMLYEEKREKANITSAAQKDGLTGLYNRKTFDEFVGDFVAKKPGNKEGALFIIDMDNFKMVNDSLGHLQGDEALKMLAGAMRVVFPGAYLGRYGGDEFVAFVVDCVRYDDICKVAGELCIRMNQRMEHNEKSVNISVSIGCATSMDINSGKELYTRADKALYHSKENGRNQFTIYTDKLEGVVYEKN